VFHVCIKKFLKHIRSILKIADCDDAIANVDVSCVNHFSRANFETLKQVPATLGETRRVSIIYFFDLACPFMSRENYECICPTRSTRAGEVAVIEISNNDTRDRVCRVDEEDHVLRLHR